MVNGHTRPQGDENFLAWPWVSGLEQESALSACVRACVCVFALARVLEHDATPCPQVYYPVRHHLVQHMVSAMQRLGFTPSVTIEQRRLAVDLSEVVIKWELQRIKDQQVWLPDRPVLSQTGLLLLLPRNQSVRSRVCVFFKPDSDMDPNSSGEGVNSVSSIKRGLSVDSAQEVKRFRTATGAISAVSLWARALCCLLLWGLPRGGLFIYSTNFEHAQVSSTVPETHLGKAALSREAPVTPPYLLYFLTHV